MIKLKDLIIEKLTDADIKIGDAYHVKSHQGQMIEFVYEKVSNGWKTRNTYTHYNESGGTFIYAAFAEAPFVNSNGVPCNAR